MLLCCVTHTHKHMHTHEQHKWRLVSNITLKIIESHSAWPDTDTKKGTQELRLRKQKIQISKSHTQSGA